MTQVEAQGALYFQDLLEAGLVGENGFNGEARTFGVQILVYAPDGRLFVRRDPDADNRYEGHFFLDETWRDGRSPVGKGYCPGVGARINSAGGGVKPQELVAAATLRELRDELGEELGEGELRVRDDFPLLVGYQRRSNNGVGEAAYLMAVVIAEYQATGREVETLTERGMWVSFDHLLEMSKKREANGMFRPAFRTALWLTGMSRGMAVDRWDHLVGSINTAVIGTSLYDAEQRGIEVNPGLFAQAVQYYLLADWQS